MGTIIKNGVLVDSTDPSKFVGESAELVAVPGSPTTFTQTYSTASATVPAATAATLTFGTNITAKTPATALVDSTASAPTEDDFNQLAASIGAMVNKLTADVLAVRKTQNSIIDALQASGLAL